jgi:hypothetical protein
MAIACMLSSCAFAAPKPTATPTATATNTPLPTATTIPTATLTPTATITPTPNLTATAVVNLKSTQQAYLAEIQPEMKDLDISPDGWHLAWADADEKSISVDAYNSFNTLPIGKEKITDFILHTKVTWDSTSGLAGCSIYFRSDNDMDKGVRYEYSLLRLQFEPAWDIEYYKYGVWQQTLTNGKTQLSRAINDKPGSSNELTLVVKGKDFTPYINKDKLMTVTSDKLADGYLGYEAFQESGKTSCKFSDNWLWLPGPGDIGSDGVQG